jgi:gliding motility-associated-like protein
MKKVLLFLVMIILNYCAFGQCSFTPAFTFSPSTPCANGSVTFTNASGTSGIYNLGSGTTLADLSYSGFSITANSGQSFIIRLYIYGGATAARSVKVGTFQAQGSTSAGNVSSLWALTTNNTVALSGTGSASVTAQNESITGLNNGGFSANGHQLGHTGAWPASLTTTEYQQFQIAPNTGYNLTLTALSFKAVSSGGSGTPIISVRYSIDGGTTFIPFPFAGNTPVGALTYTWNFGDASATTGTTSPSHPFASAGLYNVTLSAFDGSCTSTTSQTVSVTGPVVYVNTNAVGANNGTSWANAFTTLQAGIDAAASCGSQVWVAQGTYKPNSYPWNAAGLSARDYAFALKNNVAVYGGFVGTETLLSQRNYATNTTILSGDIGAGNADCHHVVVGYNINSTAILDGFTITKGYADVASSFTLAGADIVRREDGAGMINRNASPTIANCIFTGNLATDEGGAMYNYGSSPTISNCTFSSNTAKYGAVINNYSSSAPSISNSSFTSNTASSGGYGGAIRNDGSSPTISSCSFTSNSTATDGGAIYNETSSSPSFTSCIFTSNTSPSEGGAIYNKNSSPSISSSTFSSNTATTSGGDGGGIFNNSSSATIADCNFTGNTAGNGGGAIRSTGSSITVTGCTFTNNTADYGGAMQHTGAATITISNCAFTSNNATTRAGAIYNNGSTPTLTNCIFTSNHCNDDGGAMYNSNSTILTANKCIFSANSSDDTGGAVANQTSSTNTYTNCIFSGNTSDVGGGVYNNSTTTTMTNCTVYNNTAYGVVSSPNGGGGIRNSGGTLTIKNGIIWGNTSPVGPSIYSTATTTITYSTVQGGYTGTGNISTDPIFVNPSNPKGADNTWATADDGLMIHCTSPAKNTGTATGAPATDIVGSARPNALLYDMGAYEQVAASIVPSASIAITTGSQSICTGTSVEFTVSPTNCGSSPTYQWQLNGSNVGTSSTTYSNTALANGDVVKCIVTPGLDICPSTTTATSNEITMTVKLPTSSTIDLGICSNNLPYNWNGVDYNLAGTYTYNTTNAAGCDSTATLNLTIKQPTTSTTNISNCVSYFWNGTTYTSSGSYTYSTTNAQGCDSVATLNLTIKQSTTSTTNINNCVSYVWNGTTYTSSGSYTYNTTNAQGCDSVATLNLVIKQPTTSTTNISNCVSYVWNGTTYTSSGSYTYSTTNAQGCDSVATLNLTIKQPTTSTTNINNCVSYIWNGTTYTSSGTYTYSTTNAQGCDSTATLNLTIKQPTTSTTNISNCVSYVWNGTTYTSSGSYTYNTTNAAGCDSTATLNLTIKQPTTSTTNINNCESYVWNGTTYTSSGTYTYNTINAQGCDSTATLNLTIKQPTTSTTNISNCVNYTWNGTTYTSSGSYTYNTTNAQGCDSTATLNLVIKQPTTSTTNISNCVNYTWNGTTYTSSGSYTYNATNAQGCDSTATLNLVIKQPTTSTTNIANCVSYFWNGTTYTSSGTYTYGTTNATGCDSTATLNLTIKQPTTSTTNIINCVSYVWNGTTYTSSGAYTYNTTNATGCDSTATLNLTIKQPTTSTTNINNCVSYVWNGNTYTSSGAYTYSTTNAAGCDSTATLNLVIKQPTTSTTTMNNCVSYTWNGTTYTSSGTYTYNTTNAQGCDSVATLNLTIKQSTTSTTNINNCVSYVWNGTTYTSSGTYTYSTTNAHGCDSVATLNLTIIPAVTPTIFIAASANNICAGTSTTFTATSTNGGTSPSYQWQVNGSNAGTNSTTFTSTTLNNNDIVTCILTSNAICQASTTTGSNGISMIVVPLVTPTVSISASSTTLCGGNSITFTASNTNGGPSPIYQWKVNGINTGTNSSTFTSTTLNNGDIVTCVLTSNANCITVTNATSNAVTMTVSSSITPTIVITASATNICSGANATYTASTTDGGTAPIYQWKINGINAGTNSSTFVSSTLTNADVVSCVLTSNASCLSTAIVTSNSISMVVNASVIPTVAVFLNTSPMCSSANANFTTIQTNGGASPSYQWQVNGTNAGTNSSSFNTTTLNNGDIVTCILTSSANCATNISTTSNPVLIILAPTVTPTISIAANSTTICSATTATFNATVTNAGSSPVFQWKINGINAGTSSSTFTTTALNNGDIVTCVLVSNATCITTNTVTSNSITMTVSASITPTITITASATSICSGSSVTLTASTTFGGTNPIYQWLVNGNNAGVNAPTLTTTTLNNDVFSCTLNTNTSCANPRIVTSNTVAITVNPNLTPSVSILASQTTICPGNAIVFTATPVNGGTAPTYQWLVNGANAGTNSSTFSSSTLNNNDVVSCVMTSNATCLATASATSNSITLSVTTGIVPTVSIAASSPSVCIGNGITFTATPSNGGTSPVYQWKVNGTNAGTNSSIFTSTTLNNGDIITCVLTSNANCLSATTANSNSITMAVNSILTPTIFIATSATAVCSGTNVTFTAAATNVGTAPIYQWQVNGTNAGGNSSTFVSSSLANNAIVTCVLTSNAICAIPTTVTSNTITMTVTPTVVPSITIVSSPSIICTGMPVTFTATAVNGGTAPTFQWSVNNVNQGTNSSTFTPATLVNGNFVRCTLTSNAACKTVATVFSNLIIINIRSTVTPAISITSNATSICSGTAVQFTAAPVNGGTAPVYQWYLNGNPTGSNSPNYSTINSSGSYTVHCELTSNAVCATPPTVASNTIPVTVTLPLTPTISIVASSTTICPGGSITFTASPSNGGTSPAYQWKINGTNAGTNSPTFSSSTLNNGDIVTCSLISNATCLATTTASSNSITITIGSPVTPTISIAGSANNICSGTSVTFTAIQTNGGTLPVYQWKVNGINAGTNSPTFSSNSLSNNDVVSSVLTSNAGCVTTATASSNNLTMIVNTSVTPSISIGSSASNTCAGTNITFTATATNGGSSPIHQWKVNGVNAGTNSSTFNTSTLNNGDIVTCMLTSNATCLANATATSSGITAAVTPKVQPTISIATSSTTVCAGTNIVFTSATTFPGSSPIYQWKVNGTNVGTNAPTFASATLNNGDMVTCILTSSEGCVFSNLASSNVVTMNVTPLVTPTVSIAASASNTCSGSTIIFTATPTNGGTSPIYQWKVNGTNTGTNTPTFTTTILNNNDIVSCTLSSSACTTTPTVVSNGITMVITASVTPTISIVPSNTVICEGANVVFTATSTNGGTTPVYQWKINGTNVGTNSISFTTNTLSSNDVVTCTLTSNITCAATATVVSNTSIIKVNPLPTVFAGPYKTVFIGATTQLFATATGIIDSIKWTPAIGLSYDTIMQPIASPIINTLYKLRVVTVDGCSATDEVEVKVVDKISIPNAFSPNGDNINDKWEIPVLADFAQSFVQVFNRAGQLVFNATSYTSDKYWDGKKNGNPLPVGVYYYIIDLKNGSKPMSGYVTILK